MKPMPRRKSQTRETQPTSKRPTNPKNSTARTRDDPNFKQPDTGNRPTRERTTTATSATTNPGLEQAIETFGITTIAEVDSTEIVSSGTSNYNGTNIDIIQVDHSHVTDATTELESADSTSPSSLFPVSDWEERYPPLEPPTSQKFEFFRKDEYAKLDEHVIQAPIEVLDNIDSLLQYLSCHAYNDIGVVRAIFRWLVAQRPFSLTTLDPHASAQLGSPLRMLWDLKMRRYTYAEVFTVLCRRAGIQCALIQGMVKGMAYEVGDKIDPDIMSGSWCAVYISNAWRLVHPYWACFTPKGHCSGQWATFESNLDDHETSSDVTRSSLISHCIVNEFYFMCDPNKFITKCFPYDEDWQLMEEPITMEEFERLLYLQPGFYELAFDSSSLEESSSILQTNDGKTQVQLHLPIVDWNRLKFWYKLLKLRDVEDEGEYDFISEDTCVFYHRTQCTAYFEMSFPVTGVFVFELHGYDQDLEMPSDWLCSFRVICKEPVEYYEPLPLRPAIGWGPSGPEFRELGLTAVSHQHAIISICDTDHVCIQFESKRKVDFNVEMFNKQLSKSQLDQQISVFQNNIDVQIELAIPSPGDYAVRISCKEAISQVRGKRFRNVCNYLVQRQDSEEPSHIRRIKEELELAIDSEDLALLNDTIARCDAFGMEDGELLKKAKRKLAISELREVVEQAIKQRDLNGLEKIVSEAYEESIKVELFDLLKDVNWLKKRLRRLKRLQKAILEMDQKLVAELRSYSKPPAVVNGVMKATFMLLGTPENDLKKWTRIQSLISRTGKDNLKKRVSVFQNSSVTPQVMGRVSQLLSHYDLETVQVASAGAASFYLWAHGVIEEIEASQNAAENEQDPSINT